MWVRGCVGRDWETCDRSRCLAVGVLVVSEAAGAEDSAVRSGVLAVTAFSARACVCVVGVVAIGVVAIGALTAGVVTAGALAVGALAVTVFSL